MSPETERDWMDRCNRRIREAMARQRSSASPDLGPVALVEGELHEIRRYLQECVVAADPAFVAAGREIVSRSLAARRGGGRRRRT